MEDWLRNNQEYLVKAILDAYPEKSSLTMLVKFKLNENLEAIVDGENLTYIVFQLVEWVISRGNVEQFFQACYQDNPGNPKLKKLKQQYQFDKKRDELIQILQLYSEREEKTIFDTYEAYISKVRKLHTRQPQKVEDIINELDMPIQGDYSHIEKFFGYLSLKQTSTSLSSDLKRWGQKNIRNFDKLTQQLQQEQKQQDKRDPCLMIAISKSGDNYIVEAWLIKNLLQYNRDSYSDCEQLKINDKSVISTDKNLSNLPKIVINFIDRSSIKIGELIEHIHIFLPSELFNHDFDCWKTQEFAEGDEDFSIGICEDYKVVIRCSDRLRGENPLVFKWRKKAKKFKDSLEQYAHTVFVEGSSDNQKTLFEKVKQEQVIGVKITTVFEKRELVGKIIFNSAIPLALWSRQDIPNIEQAFNRILKPEDKNIYLKELPANFKSIKERREQNMNHLCLLWDDPDLLPPEQILTQKKL